ncbi:MAG TPA: alanine racemase [Bacillota bacterium]|nr:alanine racemase [Bacillota bacterium]
MARSVGYEHPTIAEINRSSFRKNILEIKKITRPSLFMAVVKTNAYGHGLVAMGETAVSAGADRLGVSTVEEGRVLREENVDIPIHLLSAICPEQASAVVHYNLIPLVSSRDAVIALNEEAKRQEKEVRVHFKLDTGLHRFGCSPREALDFIQTYYHLPHITWEGIYTHFSHADEGDWSTTEKQFALFKQTVTSLEKRGYVFPIQHVGGSTIAMERADMHLDMVRPGVSLFGYYPHSRQKKRLPLRPVMTLKSQIIQLLFLSAGTAIGYGGHYVTKADEMIAVLPIGHGDGYQRRLSNKGEVLVNGRRAPIVGMISLDQTMINVTHLPDVQVGDEVILMGKTDAEEITADEIACWMGSIVDEVLSGLMERIPRKYIG